MDLLNHWRYFLSLEKEVVATLRYVEFDSSQSEVYSFEFARLLILVCSELDVVFKVICDSVNVDEGADSVGKYQRCIAAKYKVEAEQVRIDRFSLVLTPFDLWSSSRPPPWWTAQNKVKHHRHECFNQATFGNVLNATAGLFVANLILLNEFGLLGQVNERPSLLDREHSPGYVLREEGYRVIPRDAPLEGLPTLSS